MRLIFRKLDVDIVWQHKCHYQKLGYHESKIVSRFWIVGIFLAVLTIVTLKLR
jgi:UDP-N-acetylmuramyl pentapeptide phosphotransferase/UDP-N-acetylglucosamine-1-phosphate transferase